MSQTPTTPTHAPALSRRAFVSTSALSLLAVAAAPKAKAATPHHATLTQSDDFEYEVTRSDAEWRDMLSEDSYAIMREGATEKPKTSDLWLQFDDGMYHCKGCALPSFSSAWKVPIDKGWVFFTHSQTNAVLTGIDGPVAEYGSAMDTGPGAFVEVHCRRCGSHLGHLLPVEGQQVHCINGEALDFVPAAA